jgi:hypothetical protein
MINYVNGKSKELKRNKETKSRVWVSLYPFFNNNPYILWGFTDDLTERRMFFAAALGEMQGKELQLATDPDCAIILERMINSMDDLARRVFLGSLMGS